MSRTRSPMEIKQGINMFWTNAWDDRVNYTKKLQQDIFINMFLALIFRKITLFNLSWFLKNIKLSRSFNTVSTTFNSLKTGHQFLLKHDTKSFIYYFGKINVLRYTKWTVVLTFMYIPQALVYKQTNLNKNNVNYLEKTMNFRNKFNYKAYSTKVNKLLLGVKFL